MTVSTEDFLKHHGVKGQKWGRRNKSDKALPDHFNKKQTAAVAGAAGLSYALASSFVHRKTLSTPMAIIGGTGAALAGIHVTKHLVDKNGPKRVSDIKT